ncbi:MAG: glyoxalase, partial [Actinomycetota bacterium]
MPPTLAELHIGDAAEHWSALGFDVVAGRCRLGTIDVTLTGPEAGRGIHGWAWRDTAGPVGVGDVPTASVHTPIPERAGPHPNGAVGLYYVVLFGPSWAEAAAELTALGLDPGQGRPMGSSPGANLRSLADAGDVAVEVIGPVETDPARGWRLWGTIVEVADLDATAAHLGPRLRPIKDAVQPGRRIATLERSAGSSVALAFMGPDER